jgi:hypothetical protein
MNKKEYREYQGRVKNFLESEEIEFISLKDYEADPYFSHCHCECCDSGLGGDRYIMVADSGLEYEVCQDCLYYLEYGKLDDRAMMEIEESEG